MNKLGWAYTAQVAFFVNGIVTDFFISAEAHMIMNKILLWVTLGIVMNFLWRDARDRGLHIAHGLWAFLSIIGIAIYHLAFARRHPIKK